MILTKKEIIEIIVGDTRYLKCCKKWCKRGDLYKDLYQYVMMYMCEMDDKKLQYVYSTNMYSYITRTIWINATSKTAPFYRIINEVNLICVDFDLTRQERKGESLETKSGIDNRGDRMLYDLGIVDHIVLDEENEELENEELLDHIEMFLKSEVEYWESKGKDDKKLAVKLLERYTELGSYRQLAREADIPYSTVRYTIKTLLEKINEDITSNYKRANRS